MAAPQPRNQHLLSSLTKRGAITKIFGATFSLSLSRFLPCPALSTMPRIFATAWSARISSPCVSARSDRKSGYLHTHIHTSRLRNRPLGAPLTFHRLDPRREIRSINSNYISVDRAPFSCSYFSFSSSTGTTPTEYGDWYMSVYPRD